MISHYMITLKHRNEVLEKLHNSKIIHMSFGTKQVTEFENTQLIIFTHLKISIKSLVIDTELQNP